MAVVQVQCPDCQSTDVVQYGKQANGTQRYHCDNRACPRTIFLLQYRDKGRLPAVKQQIIDMTLNGWLQLIHKDRLAPLENAPFSTLWARKRYRVGPRFRQY